MQAASVQELVAENCELKQAIFALQSDIHHLKIRNDELNEQLEWFRRQLFGQRSERFVPSVDDNQLCFEGLEYAEPPAKSTTVTSHKRRAKKQGGDAISLPKDLPVEQVFLDLPEEEKVCKETGQPLKKIGEEHSYKLAKRPASYFLKEFIRAKYALPEGEGIVAAELPDSIISRCRADESFLADLLVQKYADHLPLYRIAEILSRSGIGISRQLLSQWAIRLGEGLYPIYQALRAKVLKSENVFMDESPVKLQSPGKGKCHTAFMWVIVGGQGSDPHLRVYDFRLTRQHAHALDILGSYKGVLHSDKYGAYEKAAQNKDVIWAPCWGHIRRKFIEAESGDIRLRDWILRKIRYLFMLERVAWNRDEQQRLAIRREKEEPIIDEIIAEVREVLEMGRLLPKSKMSQALNYTYGLKAHLKNYLAHPYARLDNNVAERAIRPLALGRKNWLFMGSLAGGRAAAVILSLVQSCRALQVNPRDYLEDVLRRLMSHPASRIDELLPDSWARVRSNQEFG